MVDLNIKISRKRDMNGKRIRMDIETYEEESPYRIICKDERGSEEHERAQQFIGSGLYQLRVAEG